MRMLLTLSLIFTALSGAQAQSEPGVPATAGPDTPAPVVVEDATDTATADAEPTPEELRALQAGLDADTEDAPPAAPPALGSVLGGGATNSNPDIALIVDFAAAWFRGEPGQTGAHDPQETGFNLQQLEMHIASNVDPYFRLETNLIFSEFGVEVEEVYATTLSLPANLQLRAGQFLTRFGRLNPTHPHSWKFVDQPVLNGKFFGSEGNRGLGTEVSWLSPLPWFVELVGSATLARGACCARSFYGGDDPGVEGPEDLLYTTAIKQFFPLTGALSLAWGLSGQFGPNASGNGNRTEIYGTDIYLHFRPPESLDRTTVTLHIEAMYRTRQVPGGRLEDYGAYGQLVWSIDPTWEVGARHEYVTGVDDDPLDPEWDADRQRTSAQVTVYPSHFSRLRLQGARDDRGDDTVGWSTFLALELLIGAHGAHKF